MQKLDVCLQIFGVGLSPHGELQAMNQLTRPEAIFVLSSATLGLLGAFKV